MVRYTSQSSYLSHLGIRYVPYCPDCGSTHVAYQAGEFGVPVGECYTCGADWDASEEEWEAYLALSERHL